MQTVAVGEHNFGVVGCYCTERLFRREASAGVLALNLWLA